MALKDGMCEIHLSYWLAKIQYMLWKNGFTLNILKGSTLISDQIKCTVFPAILQLGGKRGRQAYYQSLSNIFKSVGY